MNKSLIIAKQILKNRWQEARTWLIFLGIFICCLSEYRSNYRYQSEILETVSSGSGNLFANFLGAEILVREMLFVFVGSVLLFSEVPKREDNIRQLLVRTTKFKWMWGQIFFVVVWAATYLLLLHTFLLLINIDSIDFTDWVPTATQWRSWCMFLLLNIWIGQFCFLCNLSKVRTAGIAVLCIVLCFSMPVCELLSGPVFHAVGKGREFYDYWMPVGRMQTACGSAGDFLQGLLYFIGLITVTTAGIAVRIKKSDL